MTTNPHAAGADRAATAGGNGAHAAHGGSPHGVQFVKFSFYRVKDDVRAGDAAALEALGVELARLLDASEERMLTRCYSTVGTRADTDLLLWQVADELPVITQWHAELLRSPLGAALDRPHSYLSMTMRSQYTNPLHAGGGARERLRADGGVDDYLFVYPMVKSRDWYKLPREERQRIMDEHIAIGHRYHGIKINTTYSYGLDDQEFVVAFEGNSPGEFLALVRELRDSRSSSYTLLDTPMFTCRRVASAALAREIGLVPAAVEQLAGA